MLEMRLSFYQNCQQGNIFDFVESLQGEVYRALENRKTLAFELDGKTYFIKIHRQLSWSAFLKTLLQARWPVIGAKNEWLALKHLTAAGIDSMKAVAFAQKGLTFRSHHSFMVTEALENTQSLEQFCQNWAEYPPEFAIKKALITRVAVILRTMHRMGWVHKDCYLCHFLLDPTSLQTQRAEQIKLYLIDLHRAVRHGGLRTRWQTKDIAALFFSAMDLGLTRQDWLRFLKIYFDMDLKTIIRHKASWLKKVLAKAQKLYAKFHRKYPQQALVKTQGISLLPSLLQSLRRDTVSRVLPCLLQLQLHPDVMIAKRCLRHAPNKRWVVEGQWQRRAVVAKIYCHPVKGYLHFQRELRGLRALQKANIPTPTCVYAGKLYAGFGYIVILEQIPQVLPASQLGELIQAQAFLDRVIPVLARAHEQGLMQTDLHPHNFLFTGDLLYAIDGSDVVVRSSLTMRERLQQLALLLIQMPDALLTRWSHYYQYYKTCSYQQTWPADSVLWLLIQQQRQERCQVLLKRFYRCSRSNHYERSWRHRLLVVSERFTRDFAKWLALPNQAFASGTTTALKQGRSATVIKTTIDQQAVVIKRYNMKNVWHRFRRLWQPSRASYAWYYGHWLQILRIPTARPIALFEEQWFGLRSRAFLVTEYLNGILLHRYWQQASEAQRQQMLRQLIALLEQLKQQQLWHGDLKASNLMVVAEQLYLLDLDSMRRVKNQAKFSRLFMKDVERLCQNFQAYPSTIKELRQCINAPLQTKQDGDRHG